MVTIIIVVIVALITGMYPVAELLMNNMLSSSFHLNSALLQRYGIDVVGQLRSTLYIIGGSLLILKFLLKGFNVYGLWRDGDPDANPLQYTINFIYAIAAMGVFPFIYNYFIEITNELLDEIIVKIDSVTVLNYLDKIIDMLMGDIFTAIAMLVCFAMVVLLAVKVVGRGFEMIVLQIGFPLACVGLLDNDKGVFKSYCMQIIKSILTVIVQIFLGKLSFILIMKTANGDPVTCIWAIACMYTALQTPKVLSEFMIPSGGGSGSTIMSTAHTATRIATMAKNVFVK